MDYKACEEMHFFVDFLTEGRKIRKPITRLNLFDSRIIK